MKTILVATDFSPAAMNATNYAANMAIAIKADILLLRICQVPVVYGEVPVAVNLTDIQQSAEREIYVLKEKMTRQFNGKLKIDTEVIMGSFFQDLKAVCNRVKPYAVVMGSQGTTAAQRLFFGSHAIYAIKHLMWPLITVPLGAEFSTIKKIGLASDFDDIYNTISADEINIHIKDFSSVLHVLNTSKGEKYNTDIVYVPVCSRK